MPKVCDVCGGKHYAKGKCIYHYKMPSKLNPKPMRQQTKPIAKVSVKQAKINRAYSILKAEYMKRKPFCEAALQGCTHKATDLHHANGRGQYMLDQTTYKSLCRSCHQIVELNPLMAVKEGLSASRLSNQ